MSREGAKDATSGGEGIRNQGSGGIGGFGLGQWKGLEVFGEGFVGAGWVKNALAFGNVRQILIPRFKKHVQNS